MKLNTLILIILIPFASVLYAQQRLNIYGNLNFGSHQTGIKYLSLTDSSEKQQKEIRITLWYPTIGDGEKLTFANNLNYRNDNRASTLINNLSINIGGSINLFSSDSLKSILHSKTNSIQNGLESEGRFPLLIWSIRYGTVEYQHIISEYLASHGYIVSFVEDIPNASYPWQLHSTVEKKNTLNQQVMDINRSIDFLKNLSNVNENKIGLLSWSYGGESAMLCQMNNSEIDVVIGLSSVGFTKGVYLGTKFSEKIDMKKLNVPYLILTEEVGTNGKPKIFPSQFNSMNPNSRYISFSQLSHGNFNGMEGMIPGILRTNNVQSWSKGGEIAQIGYETICEITLSFLNVFFYEKNFNSFDNKTSEMNNSLPEKFFSITIPKKE